MGLLDNLKGLFSGSKNTQTVQVNDEYEKSRLSEQIVDLVNKIKRINSFDSSIWNIANVSSYDLKRKSLDELTRLNSSLERRVSELERQSQSGNPRMEAVESAKWTGRPTPNMTNADLDRFQKGDDYR